MFVWILFFGWNGGGGGIVFKTESSALSATCKIVESRRRGRDVEGIVYICYWFDERRSLDLERFTLIVHPLLELLRTPSLWSLGGSHA